MDSASKIKEIREFVVICISTLTKIREFVVFRIPTVTEIREFVVFCISTLTEIREFVVIKIKNPPRVTEEDSYDYKNQYFSSLSALQYICQSSELRCFRHIYP
jgi:hypothetical protein